MKKEYICAIISVLLWSTTATVSKLLLGSLDSMQILLVSSLFSFIFLLIINCINGSIKEIKKYKPKDYLIIFSLGLIGIFLYDLFFYLGINAMQASQAFIIVSIASLDGFIGKVSQPYIFVKNPSKLYFLNLIF